MRGRKPLPTQVKALRGTLRPHRVNHEQPEPDVCIPPAPEHLSADARAEWDRITVELQELGLLTTIDRAALAIYCTAWGRYAEAEREIRARGVLEARAWTRISEHAVKLIKAMLAEFGLTPASRISGNPSTPRTQAGRFFT